MQFCRKVYKHVANIMVLQDKVVYSFKKFRKHISNYHFIQPFPLQTNTNRLHKFIYNNSMLFLSHPFLLWFLFAKPNDPPFSNMQVLDFQKQILGPPRFHFWSPEQV